MMTNRLKFTFHSIGLDFKHDLKNSQTYIAHMGNNINSPQPPKQKECLTIIGRKYLIAIVQPPHMYS